MSLGLNVTLGKDNNDKIIYYLYGISAVYIVHNTVAI